MVKRKTPVSEMWQNRCVLPARKLKKLASKYNKTGQFVTYALIEDYCTKQRENSKQ